MASVSLCDVSLGAVVKGDGTPVWHPDFEVSPEGPMDKVHLSLAKDFPAPGALN